MNPTTTTTTSALLGGVPNYAGALLGVPPEDVGEWCVEPVDYDFGSPTTAGLYRVRADGWSLFLKVIQSYRRWPLFDLLPAAWLEHLPVDEAWRYEADVYADGLADALPVGMRLGELYGLTALGDDRLVLAIEDVRPASQPWDRDRFTRAARLLGRLNTRLTRTDALPASAFRVPGRMTSLYYSGRLLPAALPALADDAMWNHPLMVELADGRLRADLTELADRLPAILERLEHLPQTMNHGDASPQNLLVPADEPDTFVVIDWTLGGLTAVGGDLGQLLVGLAHDGDLAADQLPALREAIAGAYTSGLADEGLLVDEEAVRCGMDGDLTIRSAFTALPIERLGNPESDELRELFRVRLALTRYLVDLGLALPFRRR